MTIDRPELRALGQKARVDHELVREIVGRDCESQAVDMADGIDALLDELDAKDRRIAELEAGLREALDWWAPGSHEFKSTLDEYDRLRKLLPSEET